MEAEKVKPYLDYIDGRGKNRGRVVLHSDMNNFFASVECMLRPEISAFPVAVCGSEEERHGIVLAKNYKAKEYGIAPSRFHIDPLVEMLCTSEDGISMVVEVIKDKGYAV